MIVADRYEIVKKIGEGGMQEVYLAIDKILERHVALKRAKNGTAERRFKRSAVLSARVNHPNVAKTLDYIDGAQPYLVEEYIDGCDLSKLNSDHLTRMDPGLATQITHHIVRGIAASHEQSVLHRDLKPSNIMIVGGVNVQGVKITDFGIAKMAEEEIIDAVEGGDATLTTSKTVVGAIPYMAPEAIETPRSVTLASDIWSLGALAYELVYGKRPFGAGLMAVKNITAGQPPDYPASDTSIQFSLAHDQIQSMIRLCLQHDPKARPTARDLSTQFSQLCYATDTRYTGAVTSILHGSYGFIDPSEGSRVFFHMSSVYGARPRVGDRVLFARYQGGGADRAFPVVKMR